jgi:HAMP domain-containing protein
MRYLYRLKAFAISYYLGDPQTDEPPIAAYASALGFDGPAQLLRTPPEMISQREFPAFDRLLAQFGVSRNDEWDALANAFERMTDGLSEHYKQILRADTGEQPVDETEERA